MKKAIFLLAVSSLLLIGCSQKTSLSGAGATFPLPYYNLVFKAFTENAGIDVSYGGIGSGGAYAALRTKWSILQAATLISAMRRWRR